MTTGTRFLVVEGTNGAGKSTLSRALSERLGAHLFHYTPEFRRLRRDLRLDDAVRPQPRLLVYLAATMHLSDLVRARLAEQHVLCDRYLASCVSLMIADGSMSAAELAQLSRAFEAYCRAPDLTLLLEVDHEVACRRIRARGDAELGTPAKVVASADFYRTWQAQLRQEVERRGPCVVLDASRRSAAELLEAASQALGERLGIG